MWFRSECSYRWPKLLAASPAGSPLTASQRPAACCWKASKLAACWPSMCWQSMLPAVPRPRHRCWRDVNADAAPTDRRQFGDNPIHVRLGDSDGTFAPATHSSQAWTGPSSMAAGDFDRRRRETDPRDRQLAADA